MSEPTVLAEIDDPTIGRWIMDGESIRKAGWVDAQDDYALVRWDEFDGSGAVRVLAVLLIDAVRRLSERIDAIGRALHDTRVDQGEVNLVVEQDTRQGKRRLEEVEERVAAMEVSSGNLRGIASDTVEGCEALRDRMAALEAASEKLREAGMNNVKGSEALISFTDKLDYRVAELGRQVRYNEGATVDLFNTLKEANNRLVSRVEALEGKPATGPLNDIANVARRATDPRHASDTVSESTRRRIREETAREIAAGLRASAKCEEFSLRSGASALRKEADQIERTYLPGEADRGG